MSDFKEWSELVLGEVRDTRTDIRDLKSRQIDHGRTLVRNTVTLEEHVKGSIATNKRLTHVEDQLNSIQDHVSKVKWITHILKPTKTKLIIILTAISLATGGTIGIDLASKTPKIKQIIHILQKP